MLHLANNPLKTRAILNEKGESKRLSCLLFVLMLPYIEPQVFKSFDEIDNFFAILKLLSACVTVVLYSRRQVSSIVLGMAALQLWIGLATLVNEGSFVRFAGPAITSVAILMIAEMAIKSGLILFLRYIRNLLALYVVINIFSIMLMQTEVIELPVPFLGIDNRWIYFFLPWITFSFALDALCGTGTTAYSWLAFAVSIVQLLCVWSVGALITMILWCTLWFCTNRRASHKTRSSIFSPGIFFTIIILLNVLLINGFLLDLLGGVISTAFDKDITLSGRTLIWDRVLDVLQLSPLFGEGVQSEAYDVSLFTEISPSNPAFWVNHPHNYFLNVAFHGGWVAAIIFTIICFKSTMPLNRCPNLRYAYALFCGMSCFFIASLVDTLDFSLFYLLIGLSAHSNSIEPASNE